MTAAPPDPGPRDARAASAAGAPSTSADGQAGLHDTASLLQLLTDNARDVLFRIRIGPPPVFEYVSPAVLAMTGYSARGLLPGSRARSVASSTRTIGKGPT